MVKQSRTFVPASRGEADTWLRDRARRKVRAHLDTREDQNFAQSVKSMIEQATREYSGRFLFELIQNGYDRQRPGAEDGRVLIILADEGDHGTLYVANTGEGFTATNVEGISSLGLSDKRIGEGIGNKGVGFKSVLEVCATPEVYSVLPAGSPGFCFRFATPQDIDDLVDGDPERAALALEEISLYSLTIPVESVPGRVTELWSQGFVTVVRLPLAPASTQVVERSLAEIESSDVPLMLFLERLRHVELRRLRDGQETVFTLGRQRIGSLGLSGDLDDHIVDLGDDSRFLVVSRTVDAGVMKQVLQTAIEVGKLDRRWGDWDSAVSVSIALPYDADDSRPGRLYTYLPMGSKAPSPLAGHLHAPFFTLFARTDLPLDHPLNDFLLREAARLCLATSEALTRWSDSGGTRMAIDAVTWNGELLPVLIEQAQATGAPLAERRVIPTVDGGQWTTLAQANAWPAVATTVLTSERARSTCGLELLPLLPRARQARLSELAGACGVKLEPTASSLADWVEAMMAAMAAGRVPIGDWDGAYADIAVLFAREPDALRGRAILLTDDGTLLRCQTSRHTEPAAEAMPYFPPARQRIDDEEEIDPDANLDLPRSLARRMFFVNRDLTWHVNRQQTRARSFLQNNGLVRRFDTRSILELIRGVLARRPSSKVCRDALNLAYTLTRARPVTGVDLAGLGLRVPTADGTWVAAKECYFSSGWPLTAADDLSIIAGTAEDRSPELHALGSRLLAPPVQVAGVNADIGLWTKFLRDIGVRDVLELASVTDERKIFGQALVRQTLIEVNGLPEAVREAWQTRLPTASQAQFPQTPYKALSPLYWLPGQADWNALTDRVREALARQILVGLKGAWPKPALSTVWEKDRPYDKDQCSRPTPLRAFLIVTPWLPIQRPGHGGHEFVRPDQCWTFQTRSDGGDEGPPRFAPLLSKPMRELLDDHPEGIDRLRSLGAGVWGFASDAARLVRHLGTLVNDGAVADVHGPQFQAMYRTAWATCVNRGETPFPAGTPGYLVADMRGLPTPLRIEANGPGELATGLVVASNTDDRTLVRLLADFGRPILTVESSADRVVSLLRPRLGASVTAAATVSPSVLVDGATFDPAGSPDFRLLTDVMPHLPVLIATLVEFRRSAFDRAGQRAFEKALDSLRRVRIAFASRVEVRIGEAVRRLPEQLNGVLPVAHPDSPTLVLERHESHIDWQTLDALAEPLMYLIGRTSVTDVLRLAAARLRAEDVQLDQLNEEDIAAACGVSVAEVKTTVRRVETAITPLLSRLYPVVAHYAGRDLATAFDPDTTIVTTVDDARDALKPLTAKLPSPPDELLERALQASSLDDLRQALKILLGSMNETLASLGPRYPAIDYSERHAEDFADHVRTQRGQIMDRIRWARWDRFAAFEPQVDWVTLRRAESITPDPGWGTTIDSLSREQMDQRIEGELIRLLGSTPPHHGDPLRTTSDCTKANTELVPAHIARLARLVRAWLTARGRAIDGPWADSSSTARVVLDTFDRSGAMDFDLLSVSGMMTWLAALDLWPDGMPLTDDLTELGLSADDLDADRAEEQLRRAEQARHRRTVLVDEHPFDLADGFAQFAVTLDTALTRSPTFLATHNRYARLGTAPDRSGSRPGHGGRSGGGTRDRGLSDQQRRAVGFAGEWLAYQWLQRVYGPAVTPECWVSEYREEMFGGSGDDGLGWDLQLQAGRTTLYYEVKTTMGDGGQVELGETQVRAAQRNFRNDQWRLIVITNVLNANRELRVLRNPFHAKSRGQYEYVGQGLRLRYALS